MAYTFIPSGILAFKFEQCFAISITPDDKSTDFIGTCPGLNIEVRGSSQEAVMEKLKSGCNEKMTDAITYARINYKQT